jgi:E3 ubiquitin-protein ligase RNF213
MDFVRECEALAAEGRQVWAFMDEVNTCSHLSLVNDIVCRRAIAGRPIARGVTFMCAVNPYRLKPTTAYTAGLDSQQKRRGRPDDAMSKLVYRVHPLPETTLDFLWDFGSLEPQDEAAYVRAVLEDLDRGMEGLLPEMVVKCHDMLRTVEDRSAVSIRDVRRCKMLAEWFIEQAQARTAPPPGFVPKTARFVSWETASRGQKRQLLCQALVLSVALCYPATDHGFLTRRSGKHWTGCWRRQCAIRRGVDP